MNLRLHLILLLPACILSATGCQVAYHPTHGLHASAFSVGSYDQGPTGLSGTYDSTTAVGAISSMVKTATIVGGVKDIVGDGVNDVLSESAAAINPTP